jgi:hypothetical protein
MIAKHPLCPDRLRTRGGSFAFLEHRFLREGFWNSLGHHALWLYVFLILVADRQGLSYDSFDKICTLLPFSLDEYGVARNALIHKDLIAFDGHLFQGLSLPPQPISHPHPLLTHPHQMVQADPAPICGLIRASLGVHDDGSTYHL